MATNSFFPVFLTTFPDLPDGIVESSTYTPHRVLTEDTRWELAQVLAEAREFEDEGENPAILADWQLVERQEASSLTLRSHISLFRDGNDGAEKHDTHWVGAGVLFYREDFLEDLTTPRSQHVPVHTRVHIPGQNMQDQLIDAWDYSVDLLRGSRHKLEIIVNYLSGILND